MQSTPAPGFHILMVDDDPDDALLFSYAMETLRTPFRFSLHQDGLNLLKTLSDERPNIIFLDLNMPTKNGYECLQEIRSEPSFNNIPVVIYSTSGNKKDIEKCFKYGADNYVIKPFSISGISTMIRKLCNTEWTAS